MLELHCDLNQTKLYCRINNLHMTWFSRFKIRVRQYKGVVINKTMSNAL